jgi:hypothetical protein
MSKPGAGRLYSYTLTVRLRPRPMTVASTCMLSGEFSAKSSRPLERAG